MIEKVLVPLDGSVIGECAIPYLIELLSKFSPEVQVEITLLQVLRRLVPYVIGGIETPTVLYTEEELAVIKQRAYDYLDKVGDKLRDKGTAVVTRVEVGDAAEEIVKVAEEINADLIAMSSHGRSGLSRFAFGSVTNKVLRQSRQVPILTVRATVEKERA